MTVCRAWHTEHNRPVIMSELKTKAAHRDVPLPDCLTKCLREAKETSTSDYVVANSEGEPLSYRRADGGNGLCQKKDHPDLRGRLPSRDRAFPLFETGQLPHRVCHGLSAKEYHPGTQHEAVSACGAVQCAYHHEQSLHFIGQPRYAHRRLVRPSFIMPKEARHEPDGNFQKPGVWQYPGCRRKRQIPVLRCRCSQSFGICQTERSRF